VRNGIVLATGRAGDVLPGDPRSLSALARCLGYPAGAAQDMVEDYLRAARRARSTYERVFFA
jgi:glutamate-ammonia-ligase adenylyltransferase